MTDTLNAPALPATDWRELVRKLVCRLRDCDVQLTRQAGPGYVAHMTHGATVRSLLEEAGANLRQHDFAFSDEPELWMKLVVIGTMESGNSSVTEWQECEPLAEGAAPFFRLPQAARSTTPSPAEPSKAFGEFDVRRILIDVVPGPDGMGQEVYAKSVADVEGKLTRLDEQLEEWQLGVRRLPGGEPLPMHTAPKDGSSFIAFFDGLPYKAHYDDNGRIVRMAHCNRRGIGRSYRKHEIDGKELLEVINEGADDEYVINGVLWSRGFDFEPTGWQPLPAAPVSPNAANGV